MTNSRSSHTASITGDAPYRYAGMSPIRRPRADALPDGLRLKASCGHPVPCGCEGVSCCCEVCPLPRCRYEVQGGLRALRNAERDPKIVAARLAGAGIMELAGRFGLSRRSVFRVLSQPSYVRLEVAP